MNNRPSLGFDDDEEIIAPPEPPKKDPVELSGFQPKTVVRPDKQKVEEAAAKAQFKSREAKAPVAVALPVPTPPKPRASARTGRSAQLNLKCRPETIEQF